MIMIVINNFWLVPKIKELNLVMDNCGDKNKKGSLLKMGAYFVERVCSEKVHF